MPTYSVETYCGECREPGCDGAGHIGFRTATGYREATEDWDHKCPLHDSCDGPSCGDPMDESLPIGLSLRVCYPELPTFKYHFCTRECFEEWLAEEPRLDRISKRAAFDEWCLEQLNATPEYKKNALAQLDDLMDAQGFSVLDDLGQTVSDLRDFIAGDE